MARRKKRQHGRGTIRRTKEGTYLAGITVNGKLHRRTLKTESDARDWLRQIERKAESPLGVFKQSVRLDSVAGDYLEAMAVKRRAVTVKNYRSHMNRVLEMAPGLNLATVTPGELEDLVARMTKRGWAPNTVRNRINMVTGCLSYAMRRGMIEPRHLPFERPEVPKNNRAYTAAESAALLAAAREIGPRETGAIMLGLYGGLRRLETFRFKNQDADYERMTLAVPKAKTDAGVRVLPLHRELGEHLRKLFPLREDGTVFAQPTWNDPRCMMRWLEPVWTRAGVEGGQHYHWLRHTWASNLANGNPPVPRLQLMAWGGWSSMRMVEHYYHTPEQWDRTAMDALSL